MLGCVQHQAAIYDRGGFTRVGPLDTLIDVDWERKRDDMSLASISLQGPSWDCQKLLAETEPNRHELVIFRDGVRVWEGPISHIEYTDTQVNIQARDVMYYLYRLIRRTATDTSGLDPRITLVQYMTDVLTTELARREAEDPPVNVLPYVRGYLSPNTATTTRAKPAYSNTVFEEIDDIARYAGMDYTVIGRSIILFDTHTVFYRTPEVSEADFMGPIIVTAYGLQHATFSAVTDGQGVVGVAGGPDPYYGLWETLATTTSEEGETEPAPDPVVFAKQAASNLVGLNPVPFLVRLPDGTQVNPEGVLSIDDLVPGARIPLRATLGARTYSMMQKLDSMRVKESAGTAEKITVNLSTASIHDEPAGDPIGPVL